jgi:hypothetical protein
MYGSRSARSGSDGGGQGTSALEPPNPSAVPYVQPGIAHGRIAASRLSSSRSLGPARRNEATEETQGKHGLFVAIQAVLVSAMHMSEQRQAAAHRSRRLWAGDARRAMGSRALRVLQSRRQWMFRQPAAEQMRSVFLQCFPVAVSLWLCFPCGESLSDSRKTYY